MTVVVAALTRSDGVVLAADSEFSEDDWRKSYDVAPKLWASDGYVFGSSGTLRCSQAIRFHVSWPRVPAPLEDTYKFAVTEIVPSLRYGLGGHGVVREHNGLESMTSNLIVAWGRNIIEIGTDFSVSYHQSGRAAIGSGYAEALGYMSGKKNPTKSDVIYAAQAASRTAQGVGGSIYTITTIDPVVGLALSN